MESSIRRSNRVLLGLTVGAIVFAATFAAAASLGLTVETLSADQQAITACDTAVTSDYTTVYEDAISGYEVDTVSLSGLAAACDGMDFKVTLFGVGGTSLGEEVDAGATLGGADPNMTLDFDFTGDNVFADDVVGIAVSITDPS